MGLYSVCDDPRVDQEIQKCLDVIVEGIRDLMGTYVEAIILVGSFGRGEGGVMLVDGRFRPVNDFDIFVVVRKHFLSVRRKYGAALQALARDLAKKTAVKQVDVCISHPLRFRYVRNLVSEYEILNGHKLLYGKMDLKQMMPRLPGEQLPLIDGTIYFTNRGSGLLIAGFCYRLGKKIDVRYRENFQIELDKAWMAMGDAYLLWKKQYHYSYVERYRRIKGSSIAFDITTGELIRTGYLEAANRHLHPDFSWPGDDRMIENWYHAVNTFGRFFLWFESQRLERSFDNWLDYSIFIEKYMKDPFWGRMYLTARHFFSTSIFTILRSQGRRELSQKFLSFHCATMPVLLFSLTSGTPDMEMIRRGRLMLGLPELKGDDKAWEQTVARYLKAFHPDGIVGELLEEASI